MLYQFVFVFRKKLVKVKPTTEKKNIISINELLQGKWQSRDDKTNFLMFDKNERKESSDGMKTWDTETFVLLNKC